MSLRACLGTVLDRKKRCLYRESNVSSPDCSQTFQRSCWIALNVWPVPRADRAPERVGLHATPSAELDQTCTTSSFCAGCGAEEQITCFLFTHSRHCDASARRNTLSITSTGWRKIKCTVWNSLRAGWRGLMPCSDFLPLLHVRPSGSTYTPIHCGYRWPFPMIKMVAA